MASISTFGITNVVVGKAKCTKGRLLEPSIDCIILDNRIFDSLISVDDLLAKALQNLQLVY